MSRKAWYYLYITLILILVLVIKNAVGGICEFCNKEFIHLSKHTWRCKSKITSITTVATESTNRPLTCVNHDFDPHENEIITCVRFRPS